MPQVRRRGLQNKIILPEKQREQNNSARAPLNRDDGSLLPEAYLDFV